MERSNECPLHSSIKEPVCAYEVSKKDVPSNPTPTGRTYLGLIRQAKKMRGGVRVKSQDIDAAWNAAARVHNNRQ